MSREEFRKGRIMARPEQPAGGAPAKGKQKLGIDSRRDAVLYIPRAYQPGAPAPLVVLLHGAGGNANHGLSLLQWLADSTGMLLLAPPSRHSTWDIIEENSFGGDVIFIDQALSQVFSQYVIDPAHLAIGGFSDGASYALCLGLTNGDLFTHIMAFSPGFFFTSVVNGKPLVYVSHGVYDGVLPITPCSRRLVPQLQRQQYNVTYHEFEGEHTVPEDIGKEAVEWFLQQPVPNP